MSRVNRSVGPVCPPLRFHPIHRTHVNDSRPPSSLSARAGLLLPPLLIDGARDSAAGAFALPAPLSPASQAALELMEEAWPEVHDVELEMREVSFVEWHDVG